jgi:hypothetical protein
MTCGDWIEQNTSWKGYQEEDNFYGILLKNVANIWMLAWIYGKGW